jgi:NADPH-dependent 2,4-dienoyl-CoA reductase/sulfur reductase-like enzyme
MAIDESFPGMVHGDMNGNPEVEDVVVAGAGPAGLMLAYVKSQRLR